MEGFHQRGRVCRHGYARVADILHGAAVEAAEAYGSAAAFLRIFNRLEQVLGPHAGPVLAGAAMHAQADEHVAGGELGDELLAVEVLKAVVVDVGQHHGYVVVEALGLEAALAPALDGLYQVAGEMGGGGGRAAVAAGIDALALLPGMVKDVNGLIDIRLIYFLRYLRRLPQIIADEFDISQIASLTRRRPHLFTVTIETVAIAHGIH